MPKSAPGPRNEIIQEERYAALVAALVPLEALTLQDWSSPNYAGCALDEPVLA